MPIQCLNPLQILAQNRLRLQSRRHGRGFGGDEGIAITVAANP